MNLFDAESRGELVQAFAEAALERFPGATVSYQDASGSSCAPVRADQVIPCGICTSPYLVLPRFSSGRSAFEAPTPYPEDVTVQVELVINSALTVEHAIAAAPTRFATMTVPVSDVAVLRCSVAASRASREIFRQIFADFETLMGESMEDNHRFLMLG